MSWPVWEVYARDPATGYWCAAAVKGRNAKEAWDAADRLLPDHSAELIMPYVPTIPEAEEALRRLLAAP